MAMNFWCCHVIVYCFRLPFWQSMIGCDRSQSGQWPNERPGREGPIRQRKWNECALGVAHLGPFIKVQPITTPYHMARLRATMFSSKCWAHAFVFQLVGTNQGANVSKFQWVLVLPLLEAFWISKLARRFREVVSWLDGVGRDGSRGDIDLTSCTGNSGKFRHRESRRRWELQSQSLERIGGELHGIDFFIEYVPTCAAFAIDAFVSMIWSTHACALYPRFAWA